MKSSLTLLIAQCSLLPVLSVLAAQEQAEPAPIPPRYQAIRKTKHTRLVQVYGSGEVQPGLGQVGAFTASGDRAVFASNVPVGEETDPPLCHLFVWDLRKNAFALEKEIALEGRAVTALALTPDGGRALLGVASIEPKGKKPAYALALWDLATGKEIRSFGLHRDAVFSLAISSDGKRALSGTVGGLAHWDLQEGKELAPLKVPDDKLVGAVAFLPDGNRALSGWGGEIRLWDLTEGKERHAYKGKNPGSAVLGLAVSADGKRFASADFDLSAGLWETETGKELGSWRKPSATQNPGSAAVALAGDGKTVLASWGFLNPAGGARESALVCRFDGESGKEAWCHTPPLRGAVPVRLHGSTVLLGGGANPFCEWDLAQGRELHTGGGPKGPVRALAQLPSGAVLSGAGEGLVYRCTPDGRQATAWRAHDEAITALATSKDRRRLLTASADKTLKLYDPDKGTLLAALKGHTGAVTSAVFGDDGTWAASGSDDRTVILWDLKEGKKRHTLEGHADGVNAVAVSPQGDWLASASDDNTVRLWPLKGGNPDPDREPVVLEGHKRQVTCVAFSPDGKHLLSAGQDQVLKLWDLAGQKVVREFKGHKNWVSAVIFHGPGRIISASDDLTVRLWDVPTGQEVDRIDLSTVADGPRSVLALGPDEFAVGTSGWVVMRFEVMK
jgi:WD40 repeat protein